MWDCHILSHMESETAVDGVASTGGQVMAAVEHGSDEELVLADVTRDGAYLRLPLAEAVSLPAWR
jgi:hypothetical protein